MIKSILYDSGTVQHCATPKLWSTHESHKTTQDFDCTELPLCLDRHVHGDNGVWKLAANDYARFPFHPEHNAQWETRRKIKDSRIATRIVEASSKQSHKGAQHVQTRNSYGPFVRYFCCEKDRGFISSRSLRSLFMKCLKYLWRTRKNCFAAT